MSAIGVFLRGLRHGRQWGTDAVAAKTGFTEEKVRCDEDGQTVPTYEDRRTYALAFGFEHVEEFERAWRARNVEMIRGDRSGIAIINKVPAGPPQDYEEYSISSGVGYEYFPRPADLTDPALFAVIVVGHSMSPSYEPGDLVIFRPIEPRGDVADGTPVFVRFGAARDHTCTFKLAYAAPGEANLELHPANPAHDPEVVPRADIDRLAVAVRCVRGYYTAPREQVLDASDAQPFPDDY